MDFSVSDDRLCLFLCLSLRLPLRDNFPLESSIESSQPDRLITIALGVGSVGAAAGVAAEAATGAASVVGVTFSAGTGGRRSVTLVLLFIIKHT